MSAPDPSGVWQDLPRPLGLAISGGSDSTALLMRALDALGPAHIWAATVEHGLRAEAVDEAAAVAQLCAKMGVRHDVICLSVAQGSNLQARARIARYEALADWAKRRELAAVALGHTQDDQAETVMMRLARGSGVDGLAGMAERTNKQGIVFVRPILHEARDGLRQMLQAKGIGWIEDPTNDDTRFDRVRMRAALAGLEGMGLSATRLAQTARWMQDAKVVLEQAADAWISQHARGDHGDAVLDPAALHDAPNETRFRVLARVLCAVSGHPYKPRFSALHSLDVAQVSTLHGCLIYPHKDTLRVTREYDHVAAIPDARWRIEGATGEMRALGEAGLAQIKDWRNTALLPRRSLLSSPSLWQGDRLSAAPLAKPQDGVTCALPSPLHLPK